MSEERRFYIVGDLPVKLIKLDSGGIIGERLDPISGQFIRDQTLIAGIRSGETESEQVSEEEFNRYVKNVLEAWGVPTAPEGDGHGGDLSDQPPDDTTGHLLPDDVEYERARDLLDAGGEQQGVTAEEWIRALAVVASRLYHDASFFVQRRPSHPGGYATQLPGLKRDLAANESMALLDRLDALMKWVNRLPERTTEDVSPAASGLWDCLDRMSKVWRSQWLEDFLVANDLRQSRLQELLEDGAKMEGRWWYIERCDCDLFALRPGEFDSRPAEDEIHRHLAQCLDCQLFREEVLRVTAVVPIGGCLSTATRQILRSDVKAIGHCAGAAHSVTLFGRPKFTDMGEHRGLRLDFVCSNLDLDGWRVRAQLVDFRVSPPLVLGENTVEQPLKLGADGRLHATCWWQVEAEAMIHLGGGEVDPRFIQFTVLPPQGSGHDR